jgi:small subunit ribosomal protein S6
MRNYELAYIADPELSDQDVEALEERVKGWIEAAQGEVTKIDRWGKRRLAYPIRKRNEGYYTIMQLSLPPQAGPQIERDLRLSEQVLRYMITSIEES